MYLAYIVPLSILIPISIGIYNYKHLDQKIRQLFYYLLLSGVINLIALIMVLKFHMRNLPLLHVYTIVEATFILNYFRMLFDKDKIKKLLLYVMVIFPIVCVLNFVFVQDIFTFNTHTRPLEAVLLTFFCLLYLYKSGFTDNWLRQPTSWFNMGIMMYFSLSAIIFICSNYLILVSKNKELNDIVWKAHATFALIMYLFWARGFSLIRRN